MSSASCACERAIRRLVTEKIRGPACDADFSIEFPPGGLDMDVRFADGEVFRAGGAFTLQFKEQVKAGGMPAALALLLHEIAWQHAIAHFQSNRC